MAHRLTGPAVLAGNDPYVQDSTQQHDLGTKGYAENGDIYRYTKIDSAGTDLIAGNLIVALAKEGNHQNILVAAAAAVDTAVLSVAVGATAVDANEYDEGWLVFNDVSPEGELYKIVSHDAGVGSENINVTIERGLLTAATTLSQVSLIRNPWNNPAISQLITEASAGVAITDWVVSVGNFGWLKTRGMASILADTAAFTAGQIVTISNQVDGSVGVISAIADERAVGQAMQTGVATEFPGIDLFID